MDVKTAHTIPARTERRTYTVIMVLGSWSSYVGMDTQWNQMNSAHSNGKRQNISPRAIATAKRFHLNIKLITTSVIRLCHSV